MARGIPAIVTPEVLQWARGLDGITIDEIAQKLNVNAAKVSAMENFFRSVEMPTSLHELGLDLTDQQIHDLAFKCSFKDTRTIGVFKQLNMRDMEKIYLMAR